MIDVDIISGFLRIIDHDTETIYAVFNLTNYDLKRITRAQKLIQDNIERVNISTNPFRRTIELYVGNKILMQKIFSNNIEEKNNEFVDLFV